MEKRKFQCSDCEHIWEVPFGTSRPNECPKCKSSNIHRLDKGVRHRGSGQYGHRYGAGNRTSISDN